MQKLIDRRRRAPRIDYQPRHLAAPPDAGRVDQQIQLVAALDEGVDRVAGGAGDGRDEGAQLAGDLVEEGGFAYVRTADKGIFG